MELNDKRIIGYRMDRTGRLCVREVGGEERPAAAVEIVRLPETLPDLILQLAWQG